MSISQQMDYVQGLQLVDITNREHVYHTGASLLVTRKEELPIYHEVFERFWLLVHRLRRDRLAAQKAPIAPRHDPKKRKKVLNIATIMAQRSRPDDPEVELADRTGSYSESEVFRVKNFSDMTSEELERVRRLLLSMRWRVSERQTRRMQPKKNGDHMDMRQVLRNAARLNGVPMHLAWRSRKIKPRPVVILADISGSMERYSRLLLQFAYALTHGMRSVEVFLFATRLTHVTPFMRLKNLDRAIDEAAQTVVDWSSGTRIGESLHTFNTQWSRRVLRRGAIVLVISDGWERGDCSVLRQEMRYLHHRCHRLIWLNPLMGDMAYQPLVEGLQAALPYIDDFLPIHNLQSLEALAKHLSNIRH